MIGKEDYDNGVRCRGMCQFCIETSYCYQYLKNAKGTKHDINKGENEMKINDLRKDNTVRLKTLSLGDWFLYCEGYHNHLFRVSNHNISFADTIPCILQLDGSVNELPKNNLVTPVEVEINIIS